MTLSGFDKLAGLMDMVVILMLIWSMAQLISTFRTCQVECLHRLPGVMRLLEAGQVMEDLLSRSYSLSNALVVLLMSSSLMISASNSTHNCVHVMT